MLNRSASTCTSMMCSPFRFAERNTSMMCSPFRFASTSKMCNQRGWNTSMMCSPFRFASTSVMCNPKGDGTHQRCPFPQSGSPFGLHINCTSKDVQVQPLRGKKNGSAVMCYPSRVVHRMHIFDVFPERAAHL
jgi:hypothetical protein